MANSEGSEDRLARDYELAKVRLLEGLNGLDLHSTEAAQSIQSDLPSSSATCSSCVYGFPLLVLVASSDKAQSRNMNARKSKGKESEGCDGQSMRSEMKICLKDFVLLLIPIERWMTWNHFYFRKCQNMIDNKENVGECTQATVLGLRVLNRTIFQVDSPITADQPPILPDPGCIKTG